MPAGRPLKFKTVKELQGKCDAFFAKCDEDKTPYTISGLALALHTSRETLMDYEARAEYSDAVKDAKLKCQNYAEQRLFGSNAAGPIFALKNYGWSDRQEITGANGGPVAVSATVDFGSRALDLLGKIKKGSGNGADKYA